MRKAQPEARAHIANAGKKMNSMAKLFTPVMLFVAMALSGCAWGPCGPVFTRSGGPKQEQRKIELQKNAGAVKDAAAKPPAPTQ